MDEEGRLEALERRLTAVETALQALRRAPAPGRVDGGPGTPTDSPQEPDPALSGQGGADDEVFWALNGLRQREPSPGAVMVVGSVDTPEGTTALWQEAAATEDLLDRDWEQAAEVLSALSHPVRTRILLEVLRGRSTAKELSEPESMGTTGQVYHHLRTLVAAGWLRPKARGHHEIPVERIVPLLAMIMGSQR